MAMKFWFGKKEAEQNGRPDVACTVLSMTEPAGKDEEKGSRIFCVPQMGGGGSVLDAMPSPVAAAGMKEAAAGTKEAAATVAVAAKAILRPVNGSPVRVGPDASAVAGIPVQSPASSGKGAVPMESKDPKSGEPAAAAPCAVAFALRPKANNSTPVPASESTVVARGAPPAASSAENDERSIVRPKADQRALYYELMNGLYDAILILDDQGHIVDSNVRVASVLGYTREDSWDLPIGKVITGMSPQMFEHLRHNLSESHQVLIDARCFRRDGSSFMGEVGVSTLSLTRGGNNMVFAIRNVERRKSAMEEMRKSQAALQIALVPAFVCDTEGFFQVVNQALLESFGIPDETQAKSVRFVDLLPDAARFFLRAACGEKIREKIQVPTPNGPSVKIEISFSPVQNGANVTAVAGSMQQV